MPSSAVLFPDKKQRVSPLFFALWICLFAEDVDRIAREDNRVAGDVADVLVDRQSAFTAHKQNVPDINVNQVKRRSCVLFHCVFLPY